MAKATTNPVNLFDAAKKVAAKKAVEKHEIVNINIVYESDLKRIMEIDETLAILEAERATLDSNVREAGKTAMAKLYDSSKSFPGTLIVVSGKKKFQFITSDKYIKVDESRATVLTETYGNDVVTEQTVYTLNTAMVEKYGAVLSELIMNSKKIVQDDKMKLIESKVAWSITKGMISKLRTIDFAKFGITQLIEDIKPIFSIKSISNVE